MKFIDTLPDEYKPIYQKILDKRVQHTKTYREKNQHKITYKIQTRLASYKQSAKRRNLELTLDDAALTVLFFGACYYCGDVNELNGIDRIDNKRGYIEGNVVSCCKQCNISKRAMTKEDFMEWIGRLIKHNSLRISIQ